ncbi:uncharacterized protein AC631_03384 [Debaryomyces fabryi]|uniref:Uncharacterized protein n=1 Tax=Debaryomyces fabryi TaxID=58627 RepID=A0A0V1PX73_9ASCO|nr:uncharacterized protein AC631_03384 [Debaryomyces fabryi]KSA00849.1 hypothetical protein AC631_03384 [Debaryomyces fabryi]
MSSNHVDIFHLDLILEKLENKAILPYFGIHPWYSHLFTDLKLEEFENEQELKKNHYESVLDPKPSSELLEILPIPISIYSHIEEIRRLATKYQERGFSVGIGEIGLDKLFRIPLNGYFGNQKLTLDDSLNKLSACRVKMEHQTNIFARQLMLASSMKKPISLHCVKAHGLLYDEVTSRKGLDGISSVILHSYSGSLDQASLWIRHFSKTNRQLYFSLSNWINGSDKKQDFLKDLVKLLGDDQILLETDVGIDRYLLDPQKREDYFNQFKQIFQKICSIKEWEEDSAKEIIFVNWNKSIA